MKYQFTDDMSEISGFGGTYEATCRAMVIAGVEWLAAHPRANPKFVTYKDVFGIVEPSNDAGVKLEYVIASASGDEATGAMMQAAVGHVLLIKRLGWDDYVTESRRRKKEGL